MTAYGYFPGCSLRGTGVAYEESLLTLFRLLDLPLQELRDWNCCGATSYMAIDENAAFLLSARNLALAVRTNSKDLVVPCSGCYLALRKTQEYVARHCELGKRVNDSLTAASLPVLNHNQVRVRHPLDVLFTEVGPERIKTKVVRHWKAGPVACYYGCQIVRPFSEVDRDHNPMRMDQLLEAAGIPTVTYPLKTKCCGGSLTGTTHSVGVRLNYLLLKEAARRGAQAMVTVCPLCQYNLDAYQREMGRKTSERLDMPVFFFTQLLGWALGGDRESLGFKRSISGGARIKQWFPKRPAQEKSHVAE